MISATVVLLALGLVMLTARTMWDQNMRLADQQDQIKRLQEYIRHLEERLGILTQIRASRSILSREEARALADAVQQEARRYGFGWQLLLAIIRLESRFDPRARSPRGAVGLMQVMPSAFEEVAAELGWTHRDFEELEDVRVNVRVGAHYLHALARRFGNLEKAMQAYHLGPSRIVSAPHEWEQRGREYVEAIRISQRSP